MTMNQLTNRLLLSLIPVGTLGFAVFLWVVDTTNNDQNPSDASGSEAFWAFATLLL